MKELTQKQIKNREACKRWRDKNKQREADRQREYIEANRDMINERQRNYRSSRKGWVRNSNIRARAKRSIESLLLQGARYRAKKKGIDFDLTVEDIVIPINCPVLGTPLVKSDTKVPWANSPSIDRVNNSKGYVKDNIQVISHRANAIKGSSSIEELELVLGYMKNHAHLRRIPLSR